MTECITQKVLTAKTRSIAGFRVVQCLNPVVWEVEDLCHTLPLDGPIVWVMGYGLCATTVNESLEAFFPLLFILPLQDVRIENV